MVILTSLAGSVTVCQGAWVLKLQCCQEPQGFMGPNSISGHANVWLQRKTSICVHGLCAK